jgi:hypothetical protein
MARKEGSFEEPELADAISLNGTGTLHTWLLVQLHPGEQWPKETLPECLTDKSS